MTERTIRVPTLSEGETITYPMKNVESVTFYMEDGSENKIEWSSIKSMQIQLKKGVEP